MMRRAILALTLAGALWACAGGQREPDQTAENVMELEIDGLSFIGPDEIGSGWTTVRINNDSGMEHFGLVYRLPDGVTAEMIGEQVVKPIQHSLTASIAGDKEKAAEIAATIPAWIADIVYFGGPGMMSSGVTGEATMYLEPGNYIVECYVKTNGIQHNYHPEPGMHGMVLAFTVRDEDGSMAEPDANVTLDISNSGYSISSGQFRPGENRVRVNFVEQQLYNDFVGHDAHVFRIDEDTDVDRAANWINFFPDDGQQTPAPAHFVGGIHDMPEGSTAYFKLDLEAGDYGIVAEIPDAKGAGLFTRFSVASD
ncbi:hypothetical protein [Erythrobacter mangrovi]|uniref:DUF4382 domain-containing protein n=1 Tax=Erythrobacter mangrovi TaxID=2739433 RepID=A0A7D4C2F5_9SPHN|nr:hypothetical protein [Erythrobacter mangrovi]QKG70345.1 hypothetical protein HQR01_02585 [Erythrobacter mangrovi]